MKQKFSTKWKASKQPRKQRKYLANAPMHIKHKFMAANLSKDLRKKYGKRSFPLRKGDEVKIMRGEFKGKIGKIEVVNQKNNKISINGMNRTKKDGTKVGIYFDHSNVQIKELNLEDRQRKKTLERKNQNKNTGEKNAPKTK
jgi:large subunit ribosomal protein L24